MEYSEYDYEKVKKTPAQIIKIVIIWIVVILVCREIFTNTKEDAIVSAPYFNEPEQILLNDSASYKVRMSVGDTEAIIKPQASYKISGRVIAKTRILGDGVSDLVPYDVGLVWGDLMKDKNYRRLRLHQYQRWITYQYSGNDEKLKTIDVSKHLSNNHLIPANKNVLKGIKKIRKYDKIYLEGYLVNCDLTYKKQSILGYNSSLSRNDTGAHACEIFYVTKIITARGTWQ